MGSAISWKIFSLTAFALCNVLNRGLSSHIALAPMVCLQYGVMLFMVIFEFRQRTFWQAIKKEAKLHIFRSLLSCLGVIAWYGSLAYLHVAQAIILGGILPLITALGAWWWLKEPLDKRWFVCFVGALGGSACIVAAESIASLTGERVSGWPMLLPLISGLCFSGVTLVTKKLTYTHSPRQLIAASSGAIFPLYFMISMYSSWQGITLENVGLIVVVGSIAAIAHLALIHSYQRAPVTQLLPVGALKWVIHVVFAAFFLGEYPSFLACLGSVLIILAIIYLTFLQSQKLFKSL